MDMMPASKAIDALKFKKQASKGISNDLRAGDRIRHPKFGEGLPKLCY